MDCQQAQNLFNAYLDGELSASLAAELGAHRLQCSDCRRALALLEVSEHILTLDRDPVALGVNFSDRLVACVARRSMPWAQRAGRWAYIAGPLAAAAVIVLAFLGVFDGRRATEVAGNRVEAGSAAVFDEADAVHFWTSQSSPSDADPLFGMMLDRAQDSLRAKQRSVESLQTVLDSTLLQPLDLFDQAKKSEPASSTTTPPPPQADSAATPVVAPKRSDGLEDL